MYFKTETEIAQNLTDVFFFLTLTVRGPFHGKDFKWKKYWGKGLISEKAEALHVEINERVETTTSSYSATGDFLQYFYSAFAVKNHQKIWSRYLIHEFHSQIFLNNISHGFRAGILKKNILWLLSFYMAVAT